LATRYSDDLSARPRHQRSDPEEGQIDKAALLISSKKMQHRCRPPNLQQL
jgi:hypothetical protein